ncbi:MAG: hypothetical protein WBP54_04295 [Pelodictyon phaeoclathratiforme]
MTSVVELIEERVSALDKIRMSNLEMVQKANAAWNEQCQEWIAQIRRKRNSGTLETLMEEIEKQANGAHIELVWEAYNLRNEQLREKFGLKYALECTSKMVTYPCVVRKDNGDGTVARAVVFDYPGEVVFSLKGYSRKVEAR